MPACIRFSDITIPADSRYAMLKLREQADNQLESAIMDAFRASDQMKNSPEQLFLVRLALLIAGHQT